MIDVELIVYKPVVQDKKLKKIKCKVKFYVHELIAEEFEKEAKSCANSYVDRSQFKELVLGNLLRKDFKGEVKEILETIKKASEEEMRYTYLFLSSVIEDID